MGLAITKQLRVLEVAGLMRCNRWGRERIWQLDTRRLDETYQYRSTISTQRDEALARLRPFVEE